MKRLLNTLYVTTQGAYLARENETVVLRVEQETRLRVPLHTLCSIVCFGRVSASPALMHLCGERQVALSFLSEHGRFLGRVEGPLSGNVLLRRQQYRWADDLDRSADIARAFVIAKVANCRTVLLRALRDHATVARDEAVAEAAARLARILQTLSTPLPLQEVRGCEGEAAHTYFSVFDALIVQQKQDFFFTQRTRRPPLDPLNALLSFVYTLLTHDVASALSAVGLDPAVGFLHRDRSGRPSLALDLMEELRPLLGDRLVLSLVNRQQVRGEAFRPCESGAVFMDDDTRKTVITAYQQRKQEELQHPFLQEKIALGLLPHAQALLLARYLRGDLDGYPPYIWK